jgi:hypothetical protein
MIIVGSMALKYRSIELRRPADIDLVADFAELQRLFSRVSVSHARPIEGGSKYVFKYPSMMHEVEIAWPGSTAAQLIDVVTRDDESMAADHPHLGSLLVPSLDFLYGLKMSHRFKRKSKHFLKTMRDIRAMRDRGAQLHPEHAEFLKAREAESYSYPHPKLNVSKEEFFSGEVNYIYDHDSIHEAVKHMDRPAYTYFKPNAEVMTDRVLFDSLPRVVKLYSVLEEAYVLALERSQIPHGDSISPRDSFLIALEKVCTSIASGWWREFAWEHYDEVLSMYSDDYLARFWEQQQLGKVKAA